MRSPCGATEGQRFSDANCEECDLFDTSSTAVNPSVGVVVHEPAEQPVHAPVVLTR